MKGFVIVRWMSLITRAAQRHVATQRVLTGTVLLPLPQQVQSNAEVKYRGICILTPTKKGRGKHYLWPRKLQADSGMQSPDSGSTARASLE